MGTGQAQVMITSAEFLSAARTSATCNLDSGGPPATTDAPAAAATLHSALPAIATHNTQSATRGSVNSLSLSLPQASSGLAAAAFPAGVRDVVAPGVGAEASNVGLARVKLADISPEDGAASCVYTRALETLSSSLSGNYAAIIELNGEDAALMRCALDSAKLYFRSRGQAASWSGADWIKSSGYMTAPTGDVYCYSAGSAFGPLLDDSPLTTGEISSSVLTAISFQAGGKGLVGESEIPQEVEKGLLMLIASDSSTQYLALLQSC